MSANLAVIEERETAAAVKAQVNLIQEVMLAVMKEGTHFGTITGCGDKKILFKPGAEVLMTTFRLAVDPEVEELPTSKGFSYRVKARITSQKTGLFLGAGVGEASTKEEKYHWRRAVNSTEFEATPADERRIKYASYQGKDSETLQVMTNPADKANTVLKMAKKRALVDAVLTITAASDIFTQDLEGDDGDPVPPSKKTDTVKPKNNGGEETKDVRKSIREAIAELCEGDVSQYDSAVRKFSGFGEGDNHKCIEGFEAIDNVSEKWCGSTLGKVRKAIAEGEK